MLRILIADDHPVLMQALTRIIQEEFPGVYVEGATDTSILITKVESGIWDLVISDLAMPGGGGFFALKKIKAINQNLPVVILSTYPREQYEPRVIKAGAEDFVSKDSLPGGLIKAVRRILSTPTTSTEPS
ncbi:MAG: response regulator transcription factor [Proteobacteria bacterium]|nr:MAG: response regulator transcription factor [Pseudomonadota bacterium]